jgi:hypothetical protein
MAGSRLKADASVTVELLQRALANYLHQVQPSRDLTTVLARRAHNHAEPKE